MCHHKAEADVLHILPSNCWASQDKSSKYNISEKMTEIDATNLSQLLPNDLQTETPITNTKETIFWDQKYNWRSQCEVSKSPLSHANV